MMNLGNILKKISLVLLCLALAIDYSVAGSQVSRNMEEGYETTERKPFLAYSTDAEVDSQSEQRDFILLEMSIAILNNSLGRLLDVLATNKEKDVFNIRDLKYLGDSIIPPLNDILCEYGNKWAIEKKTKGYLYGLYGYEKDLEESRRYNDQLVERGDLEAIERKIEGLEGGFYGYKQDLEEARKLNDQHTCKQDAKEERKCDAQLIEQGDLYAIRGKVLGLIFGMYGYEKDLEEARKLNDQLVEQGDPEAIERKIEGLENGSDGYEQDPEELRKYNDQLVEQGNQEAKQRKIDGFILGRHGYKQDPQEARKYIDQLVKQGDPEAKERKIEGYIHGMYGYDMKPSMAKQYIESQINKGNQNAIWKKIKGLAFGSEVYKKDVPQAICTMKKYNRYLIYPLP